MIVWLQMVLLLKEYLSSRDADEAVRCLLDLEVPHFHHELVYEVTVDYFYHDLATAVCAVNKSQ